MSDGINRAPDGERQRRDDLRRRGWRRWLDSRPEACQPGHGCGRHDRHQLADIITTGAQTYGDNVHALGADTHLTGSTVTTQGTVTGNTRVLGITGNAVFGNNTADTVTGLASLSVSGTTGINTNTLSSTGAQTYTGAVVLGADTTLSGIGVSFASTVKSDGTNRALTLNDSGTTTFGGAVGGDGSVAGDELASLTTTAGGTTAINGGRIITTGTQTYGDNVTLGADTNPHR